MVIQVLHCNDSFRGHSMQKKEEGKNEEKKEGAGLYIVNKIQLKVYCSALNVSDTHYTQAASFQP